MAEVTSFTSVHLRAPQEHLGIPLRGISVPYQEGNIANGIANAHECYSDSIGQSVPIIMLIVTGYLGQDGHNGSSEKHHPRQDEECGVIRQRHSVGYSAEALALFSVPCCS